MIKIRVLVASCLLLGGAICLIGGLLAPGPPAPRAEPAVARRPRPKRSDANEGPVDIKQLQYHDPSIRAVVAEMNAITEEIAGDDWLHDPWHQRRRRANYRDFTAVWGSTRSRGGYISNIWHDRPLHIIRLTAAPGVKVSNDEVVWDATVIASWYPESEKAWGAHVIYSTSLFARPRDVQRDNFQILFNHRGVFTLGLPGRGYNGKKTFGDVEYQFGFVESPASDRDIRPYIESPESMRDHAIGVIEYLEERLYKEIPSGKAITSVRDPNLPAFFNEPEDPPWEPVLRAPFPDRYEPTHAQREDMLEQAIGDLQERKRLWQEDYREFYAAAERAFPLKRLFAVEVKR